MFIWLLLFGVMPLAGAAITGTLSGWRVVLLSPVTVHAFYYNVRN